MPLRKALLVTLIASLAPAKHLAVSTNVAAQTPSRYLFAWAGDEDRADSDFLAVIDLQREGGRYGTIVATTPIGEKALWPHHTEHALDPGKKLFANGFASNRNVVFDLHDPLKPEVVGRFGSVGGLSFIHSFTRLPNGHVLATFQGHGENNESPGGLAEMDQAGRLIRSGSSADPTADPTTLRPYSLAVVPSLDRVVIGLTFMPIPAWHPARASIEHDHSGNQVQVWRLSDLSLIKTIKLAEPDGPNEPRVLQDGRTVLVNTERCRLYRVTGLDGLDPQLDLVHQATTRSCATPIVVGNYWIQANAAARRVFSLDVKDPSRISEVSSVSFDDRQRPHWVASDGTRVVVVNEPTPQAERRMWMLRFDRETGRLDLDTDFRDAGSDRPGLAFDRQFWPHGGTGAAVPHGTVFGW
jgi:hypothetical protein